MSTNTNTTHIMLDLETLGTKPGSVILSIGAYIFLTPTSELQDFGYHRALQVDEQVEKYGLTIDPNTAEWWKGQSEEAKLTAFAEEVDIFSTLCELSDSLADMRKYGAIKLWGNSARFDLSILEAAYQVCNIKTPWTYKEEGCYRTLAAVFEEILPRPKEFEGTPHNALHDAINQGKHAFKILHILDTVYENIHG